MAIGVLVVAGMAVGCSSGKKDDKKASVEYAPPPVAPVHDTMPVTPVATAPVGNAAVQPVGYERPAPANYPAPAPTGGTKYVVKKGDTLWSIAQRTYNDGQQWKRIVAANPNIKGERVMVGQTIILP